jgi:CRISPR system Cascade subunit CasE
MIYLSRLSLNARSNRAQSEVRNPYEMHRSIARAFGDTEESQAAARCLFRIEDSGQSSMITVLVQSKTAPDWEALRAHAGDRYFAAEPEVKEVALRLSAGERLAFRLRANPTVAHDGKRTGLYDDEARLKWLERKAEISGFGPLMVRVVDEPAVKAKRKDVPASAVFSSARFEGLLVVKDADLLAAAVENGIGAAKGFGFGLLSLARA